MLRPGVGPRLRKGASASRSSPSSADWSVRLKLLYSRPTPGCSVKFLGPRKWCKANFNYTPEQADELQLQAGEIVEVIKEVRG